MLQYSRQNQISRICLKCPQMGKHYFAHELEQLPGKLMQQGSAQAKRIVKLAGMFFTVLILLTVVLGIVLINILG